MIIGGDYVYISVPKCGTHTMYHILETYFGGVRLSAGIGHEREVPLEDEGKFRFTVVRNPYARMVSAWWSLTQYYEDWPECCFEKFLKLILGGRQHITVRPMHEWLRGIRFDRRIKLEELGGEFARLPFVGDQKYELSFLLKRVDDWRKYVTPLISGMIREWVGSDFEEFGYSTRSNG